VRRLEAHQAGSVADGQPSMETRMTSNLDGLGKLLRIALG
jgi:hypothetical protein